MNDQSKQRSRLFAKERRSLVRRQGGRSGNRSSSAQRACASSLQRFNASRVQPLAGFTLLEMLIVVGIIAMLMVLIAPAFTTIKSGGDVTSAAYTIKGVLDTARTFAKANDTYTWVGFLEENVANPASPNSDTPPIGRLIMSIVASRDGTMLYPGNLTGSVVLDPPSSATLLQVGKL